MDITNDILSVKDLAKILGVSKSAILYKIQKGYLPNAKIGNQHIFYKKDLVKMGILNGYESTDGEVFYAE